jgi:hypothetical protein
MVNWVQDAKSSRFDKLSMRISTEASVALSLSLSKGEGASPLSQGQR